MSSTMNDTPPLADTITTSTPSTTSKPDDVNDKDRSLPAATATATTTTTTEIEIETKLSPSSNHATGETTSTSTPTDTTNSMETTTTTTNSTNFSTETTNTVDPLAALSSMWSGWLSPSPAPATSETTTNNNNSNSNSTTTTNTQTNDATAEAAQAAATTANDLFQGAGKMWNDFGATLKDAAAGTVANVDTSVINEQVDVLRQQSNKIMEDVSRSVQESLNISNISLPSTQDIDISASAQAITSQTKQFLDKASSTIEQGRKDALEIFVDDDKNQNNNINNNNNNNNQLNEQQNIEHRNLNDSKGYAPWDVEGLPENERKYADTLRREMLKLVVDAIYSKKKRTNLFLSDIAKKRGFDQFDLDSRANEAVAALDADKNMRRLRAGLVPGKMKEEDFWTTYFYHVQRIRLTLLANGGVMPEGSGVDDEEDDDDDLFGDDESSHNDNNNDESRTVKVDDTIKTVEKNDGNTLDNLQSNGDEGDDVETTSKVEEDKKEEERDWDGELDAAFAEDD